MTSVFTADCYATIPGYPGYLVGTDGSVLTELLNGSNKRKLSGTYRLMRHRYASEHLYPQIELFSETERWRVCIHQLVLEAFVGPRPEGHVCRHLDGTRLNNSLENLAWGTKTENAQDRIRHGTDYFHRTQHGEKHFRAKLSTVQVDEIRRLRAEGVRLIVLAEKFGVQVSTISRIANGTRRPQG